MTSESETTAAAAPLARIVHAEFGEGLVGVLVGMAANVVIFSTMGDLGLSGTGGRPQVAVAVFLPLLWAVNLLATRPRQLRAFGSAVTVGEAAVSRGREERKRHLRRDRLRMAAIGPVMVLIAYGFHAPLAAAGLQLILVLNLVYTWRTASWWEKRHGVHLWKPPLSAVGREAYRASPVYVTPARVGSLVNPG
ncbi:hypothetical protein ABT026_07455 [Streptomyces sp. NPDC002734]|uniref:hypothetical protein n=1 Tax=Streptomyces sp. NPDC002734 TaxID=3154426 RepID=UPI00331B0C43